jgi:hypothetical protein
VDQHSGKDRPKRLCDQKDFCCDHEVQDEKAVGNAGKHLRARQGGKHNVAVKGGHASPG